MLLHGLGGNRRQPLSLIGPALPPGAMVIAPDVRAHGTSPLIGTAENFTFDALAAEIAADLPREPLTLIGISMGAALCVRIALRGDVDVERLILIRPAFTDEPLPHNLAEFPRMGQLLEEYGAELAEERYRSSDSYRLLYEQSPLGAAGAIEQFRQPDAAARAIRLIEIPRNVAFDTPAELASITVPVTILAAPRDPVHPVSVAELWHAAIAQSELVMLPARDDSLAAYTAATRSAVAQAVARPVARPWWLEALRALAVIAAGLVMGGITSFGQQYLPEQLVSFANSAGSWTLLIFGALLVARLRMIPAIIAGVLALIAMNEGYGIVSTLRGFDYTGGLSIFWTFAAIGVGPVLGIASVWFRSSREVLRALAAAAPSAVVIGEGIYGLTVIADTTSPVYWALSILSGIALIGFTVVRRVSSRVARVVGLAAVALGAAAFVLVYTAL
ncbi:MAG: DUF6518 family protein [Microbacteriaceae bacterium]